MSVATVLPLRSERTPRQILREWFQTVTGEGDEIDVAALTDRAERRFADDEEMKAACLAWAVRDLMPQVASQQFHRMRATTHNDFEGKVAEKLTRWYESSGPSRQRKLLEMRRPDVAFALGERKERVAGEMRAIGFLNDIHSNMKSDKKTVRQSFTDKELTGFWRRHYDSTAPDSSPRPHPAP